MLLRRCEFFEVCVERDEPSSVLISKLDPTTVVNPMAFLFTSGQLTTQDVMPQRTPTYERLVKVEAVTRNNLSLVNCALRDSFAVWRRDYPGPMGWDGMDDSSFRRSLEAVDIRFHYQAYTFLLVLHAHVGLFETPTPNLFYALLQLQRFLSWFKV